MTVPIASGQGSNTTNAGAVAANLPAAAPAVGDRAFIVIAHRDNAVGTPTPSDTAGFGPWSQVSGSPVVQGAARLTVWQSVVESTTPTAPVISDSGDHQQHRVFYVSHPSGTPEIHATQSSVDATSDTSGVAACPATTVDECLVFLFAASDTPDANTTTEFGSIVNADLTSITERADNSVQTGLGSSKLIASGIKATAGSIADWTYTKVTAGVKAHLVVAVSPPTAGTTHFGAFSLPVTVGKDFNGYRKVLGQFALPAVFGKDFAGRKETFGQFVFPIGFGKDVAGRKETFGEFTLPVSFGKEVVGYRQAFGQFSLPLIFGEEIAGRRGTFGQFSLPITLSVSVDGYIPPSGPQTYFGQFSLPVVFDADIETVRETFAQFSAPLVFESSTQGLREAFSSFTLPIAVGSTFGPGHLTVRGAFDLDLLLAISTSGRLGGEGIILNDALALYLGEIEVLAVYVGSEQVW